MLLVLDIGNTNVTVGVFNGEELRGTWRLATDIRKMPDEYAATLITLLSHAGISLKDIDEAAMCSSVPPLVTTLSEVCRRYFNARPLVVAAGIKTGIKVLYENPREVGADRIADAVAAFRLYGGPVIVVDYGTAMVFDAVSAEGEYLGGAIAPGIGVAMDALFERTARLPRIERVPPKTAIGRNTIASIQSGLILGYIGLVENLVQKFKEEMGGNAKVVATGGEAELLAPQTSCIDLINPNLTLLGLQMIHELNRPD
ncbi:MAG: type III pantothenate kinase [Dehalococcoidia bacterium]|nr:type III pantothenate kinase [Dehalococcoidia bacterium]